MNPDAIRFEDVEAGYPGGFRIADINFSIGRGERCALLGSNGSGKSTLLRAAGGLLFPTRGSVWIGADRVLPGNAARRARTVAGLPAEVDCPLPLRVEEFVALARAPHGAGTINGHEADHPAVREALDAMDLSGRARSRMDQLSAGERQRAGLALVLAQEPDVLLLDEPTAHLDLKHAVRLFEVLEARSRSRGLSVLYATHDLQLASDRSTRVILLERGHMVAIGLPAEVMTAPHLSRIYETEIEVRLDAGARWIRRRFTGASQEQGPDRVV